MSGYVFIDMDSLIYSFMIYLFIKCIIEWLCKGKLLFFAASVEIQFQGVEDNTVISWSLLQSNCKATGYIAPTVNTLYKTECLLTVGQTYTLKCEGREDSSWFANYLIIENSVYCEYAKGTKLIDITITGKFSSFILEK